MFVRYKCLRKVSLEEIDGILKHRYDLDALKLLRQYHYRDMTLPDGKVLVVRRLIINGFPKQYIETVGIGTKQVYKFNDDEDTVIEYVLDVCYDFSTNFV